jgi:hypothetical protein
MSLEKWEKHRTRAFPSFGFQNVTSAWRPSGQLKPVEVTNVHSLATKIAERQPGAIRHHTFVVLA